LLTIAIDFDGTIVTHEYPKIGKDVGAFPWLKLAIEYGHRLILFTMRSGRELREAVEYCRENGVEFYSINDNPEQNSWTTSRKVYANLYIDDAALSIPLAFDEKHSRRPFVDWGVVGPKLIEVIKNVAFQETKIRNL
jgi:hydroxymethylpyrimidine pyrophosphatase-like HAD family hydrolase